MVNEILPLVALGSVIFGVILSIAKGYKSRPAGEPFKVGRFLSSLVIGVMGTVSVSMLIVSALETQLNEMGIIALIVLFIGQGFATDQGLSELDK